MYTIQSVASWANERFMVVAEWPEAFIRQMHALMILQSEAQDVLSNPDKYVKEKKT